MGYGSFGGGALSCSFDEVSILSFLSMFVCVVVTLSPRVVVSVDKSLFGTSDAASSSGQCIGAKCNVCSSFTFGLSP